jgi:hypothetical protein
MQKSLKLTDYQMGMLIDIVPMFNGDIETIKSIIAYYMKNKTIIDDTEEMIKHAKIKSFRKNADYKAVSKAFEQIDEFSTFSLSIKDKE